MLDERHLELIQQLFDVVTDKMDKFDSTLVKQTDRINKMELEQVKLDGKIRLHPDRCPYNVEEVKRISRESVDVLRKEIADRPKTARQKLVDYAIIIGCIVGLVTFILGIFRIEKVQDENNLLKKRIEAITKEK